MRCFTFSSAPAITGAYGVGVTRFTLCTPLSAISRKSSESESALKCFPSTDLLISRFWQNTQRRLHPPKKTVPDPFLPLIGGSSKKWRETCETTASEGHPQYPISPAERSALHSLGQILQDFSNVSPPLQKMVLTKSKKNGIIYR